MKKNILSILVYNFIVFLAVFFFTGCETPHKAGIKKEISNKVEEVKEYIEPVAKETKENAEYFVSEVKRVVQSTSQAIQGKLNKPSSGNETKIDNSQAIPSK